MDTHSYACVFCGQTCYSVGILTSHESTCPKRTAKMKEWNRERAKYIARYTHTKHYKEAQ